MRAFAFAVCLVFTLAATAADETALVVEGHALTAEIAATRESREQGLMHREMLPENRGMLFMFDRAGTHTLWMANTFIALSAAFLDEDGVILAITIMQPRTSTFHMSPENTRYALEMNAGWFTERGITSGARVEGIPRR